MKRYSYREVSTRVFATAPSFHRLFVTVATSTSALTTVSNMASTAVTAMLIFGVSSLAGLARVADLTLMLLPFNVSLVVQRTTLIQTIFGSGGSRRFHSASRLSVVIGFISVVSTCCLLVLVPGVSKILWVVPLGVLFLHIGDYYRYELFSLNRPRVSLLGDIILFSATLLGLIVSTQVEAEAFDILVLSWVGGSLVSVAVLASFRTVNSPLSEGRSRVLVGAVSIESALTLGAGQLLSLSLGLVVAKEALGEFRLAQMSISPLALISLSVVTSLAASPRAKNASVPAGCVALLALAIGTLILINPFAVMSRLGISQDDFSYVVMALGLAGAFSVSNNLKMIRLRPLFSDLRLWIVYRSSLSLLEPAVGLLLALQLGALGAALGGFAHQVCLWFFLRRRSNIAETPGPVSTELRGIGS